ncbi:plasmid pRiA4b ORF-3 family protein, partial [Pseudomonas viridiflava]|uniref:plasmid pRiA4b ORF-3 family protein n=1 Tax=Pseudomonas viridiflava TaxID=33069 RepID=UPI0013CEF380
MAKIIHFPTADSDLLLLHIELKEITPKIWRRFAVPANITLVKLHRVIQDVMGWSDSHLREFEIAGERYGA